MTDSFVSFPKNGLITQEAGRRLFCSPTQPTRHPAQGAISSVRPSRILLTNSGSASSTLPSTIPSALSSSSSDCASSGVLIFPTRITGTVLTDLIRTASSTFAPASSPWDGMILCGTSYWEPPEISSASIPCSISTGTSSIISSTVFPPGTFSLPDILRIMGNSFPHFALIASTTSSRRRARFIRLPPYSSVRVFLSGDKNDPSSIYPCAQCSSIPSKPACFA